MFANVALWASRVGARALVIGKKHLPEILTYSGIAGFIGTVVCACKATTRAEEILDEQEQALARHQEFEDDPAVKYTAEDHAKDDRTIKYRTRWKLFKNYIPTITMLALSITLILCGFNILQARSAALAMSYKAAEKAYQTYRERVREKYGEEADLEILEGKTVAENIDGAEVKAVSAEPTAWSSDASPYAVWFSKETSRNWKPDPEANWFFLQKVRQQLTDTLHFKGYLFLNEAYEALGMKFGPDNIPYRSCGQFVGWVESKDGSTDNVVDFGLDNWDNPSARAMRQNKSNRVLLDFNVDGVIYDQI